MVFLWDVFLIIPMQAYICQGDAFLAMDQFDDAGKSYSTCLELDPSIRRSKSFRVLFNF